MNVSLTPELERLVQAKVTSGRYASASEVVREALRLLEDRDTLRNLTLTTARAQVARGIDQAKRGELVDGDAVFDRIESDLKAQVRRKRK